MRADNIKNLHISKRCFKSANECFFCVVRNPVRVQGAQCAIVQPRLSLTQQDAVGRPLSLENPQK